MLQVLNGYANLEEYSTKLVLQSRKEKTTLVDESGIVSLNLRIVENDAVRNYILICNFGRGIL